MSSDDANPKRAAWAKLIEEHCADGHDEPSTLVSAVIVAEMQTLDGTKWLHRSAATGTDGEDRTTSWLRRGMFVTAIEMERMNGDDEEDE